MTPCHVLEFVTPKKLALHGLWFGPKRPKRVIIYIHGLAASAFQRDLAEHWVDTYTAVITFSNRGHDKITKVRRLDNSKKGYHSVPAGESHEIFTDCVDDIEGAVRFARKQGVREIYLAGHSTGCQKSVYYASRKPNRAVRGLILLAPISDYSSTLWQYGKRKVARATAVARALVRKGRKRELLPHAVWQDVLDAQRFLSLYTPESAEEVFSYARPERQPRTLKKVRVPMLVLMAGKDEHGDLPATEIAKWFARHVPKGRVHTGVIPNVLHGFRGGEKKVASLVRRFITQKK